jgi:hypothetical protein
MKKIIVLVLGLALVVILSAYSFGSSDLNRNQSKWQDANITHYRFQLGVSCFCPVAGLMPLSVEVMDGEIVSITDVNGDVLPQTDPMSDFVLQYATIDRLFSALKSDNVKGADELTITYDTTYGFPADVSIDFIKLAMDDELYLSATAFEPLP